MTKTKLLAYINSFSFRYSLKTAVTLLIAFLCCYYFSLSNEFWIILAAFFVSQATRGTPFKQTIIYFFLLSSAVLIAYYLKMNFLHALLLKVLIIFFFMCCSYFSFVYRFLNEVTLKIFIFSLFLLIAYTLPAVNPDILFNRVTDILIGTLIGMLISELFFPLRVVNDFKLGMLPLLKTMITDLRAIKECLFHHEQDELTATKNQQQMSKELKKILEPKLGLYPEWIYEVGFNPELRAGFRFFLIKLERIIEILFSLEYLVSKSVDESLLAEINHDLSLVIENNAELFEILMDFMQDEGSSLSFKETRVQSDFTSDILSLNQTVKRIIPSNMELLDISPDYVTLTNIVRNIKDMRELLLQLIFSFPTS